MISISMPADFPVSLGSLATVGGTMRRGLAMLDGTDGAARLIFARHGAHCRTAALDEWLAIVRVNPPLERGVQMLWMLDARTTSWPGGPPEGAGRVLWFRATGEAVQRDSLTLPGVLRAAGHVDAAQVRVTIRWQRGQSRLCWPSTRGCGDGRPRRRGRAGRVPRPGPGWRSPRLACRGRWISRPRGAGFSGGLRVCRKPAAGQRVMPSAASKRTCCRGRGRSPLHTRPAVAASGHWLTRT